jgi:hypothetical protein
MKDERTYIQCYLVKSTVRARDLENGDYDSTCCLHVRANDMVYILSRSTSYRVGRDRGFFG